MDSSSFSDIHPAYPDAELLTVGGSTCDCYRVKLYGKFHFMKRLKPELRTNPRYVSAMQKEFETGYRLEHPHLVRYVSKGDDYLLTEYVDGENLRTFTDSHPDYFKFRKNAERFLRQLLDVVGYLHQHQVVHLDLKPDNILITRIGYDVKLTDLGYCYTDTYTDTMGRTDKYAAPEQLNGLSKVDARTDIYAIGKILQTLPCAHIYNKVIARCTAEDPSKRYQTVDDLQGALKPTHSNLLRVTLLTVALGLIVSFLIYRHQHADTMTLTVTSDSAFVPRVDTAVPSSDQIKVAPPQKHKNDNPSTPPLEVVEKQSQNQENNVCELSDLEKQEIRKITLSIVQPVYQRSIVPVVNRILQGDYDGRRGYISDSLSKVYVAANEEVFAELRSKNMENKYTNASVEDVNQEIFNAIGDAMNYYSQKVTQHFYPAIKLPPNPFVE